MSPKPELGYVLLADRTGLPLALSRIQEGGKASQEGKLSKDELSWGPAFTSKASFPSHRLVYLSVKFQNLCVCVGGC